MTELIAQTENTTRLIDRLVTAARDAQMALGASQFTARQMALREAAKSGNKARILEEVGIPLLYIDAQGNRREIEKLARAMADAVWGGLRGVRGGQHTLRRRRQCGWRAAPICLRLRRWVLLRFRLLEYCLCAVWHRSQTGGNRTTGEES